MTQCE